MVVNAKWYSVEEDEQRRLNTSCFKREDRKNYRLVEGLQFFVFAAQMFVELDQPIGLPV
jgi:hypothetical protein